VPAFVINYDLFKGNRRDYRRLYAVLERSGAVRATESSWYYYSRTGTAVDIGRHLKKLVYPKDKLTVNVLAINRGWYSNQLSPEARRWVREHLKSAASV